MFNRTVLIDKIETSNNKNMLRLTKYYHCDADARI